jgi:hypothetical protein
MKTRSKVDITTKKTIQKERIYLLNTIKQFKKTKINVKKLRQIENQGKTINWNRQKGEKKLLKES